MIEALFPAGFAVCVVALRRQLGNRALFAAPLIWAGLEYLRLQITGIGWNSLGYSQSFQPALLWPARYGGLYLISAIIILPSAAVVYALIARARNALITAVSILLMVAGIYLIGLHETKAIVSADNRSEDVIEVLAIQPVAPVGAPINALNDSLSRQFQLTLSALAQLRQQQDGQSHPTLVVWPEGPYNFNFQRNPDLARDFGEFTRKNQIYLMLNADTDNLTDQRAATYNSVVVIGPTGEFVGQYDKIHLLPFGEYVPWRNYLPLIDRIPALAGDYTPAQKYAVIKIEGVTIGAFICFESVFPDIARELARAGAAVFINVADDAWFGPTPILHQHLAHVAMRAAETGLPIMRAANSGITAYFEPDGRMLDETAAYQTATLHWRIKKTSAPPLTFYARYGDLFAWSALSATVALLIFAAQRRSRRQPEPDR
jgi:apolipoprotein N-acyltransferase